MKTFLSVTAAILLSAGSVWAGGNCQCGGATVATQAAPTPVAAPAMAANTGDRRTYSYEPSSSAPAMMSVSSNRVYARAYHAPAAPSFTMQKSMRAGYVGR